MNNLFVHTILREISIFIFPITLLKSDQHRAHFLGDIQAFDSDLGKIEDLRGKIVEIEGLFEKVVKKYNELFNSGREFTPDEVLNFINDLSTEAGEQKESIIQLVDSITSLISSLQPVDTTDYARKIGKELLDYFLTLYINNRSPHIFWFLCALQIIETVGYSFIGHNNFYPAKPIRAFRYKNLKGFISDPLGYIMDTFLGADVNSLSELSDKPQELSDALFPLLGRVIKSLGGIAKYGVPTYLIEDDTQISDIEKRTLDAHWSIYGENGSSQFGFQMYIDESNYLCIVPNGSLENMFDLGSFSLDSSIKSMLNENSLEIGQLNLKLIGSNGIEASTTFSKIKQEDQENDVFIGIEDSTFLSIKNLTGKFDLIISSESLFQIEANMNMEEGVFTLRPTDSHPFLSAIVPTSGIDGVFDIGVGYDFKKGFHIKGGGGLSYQSHKEKTFGPFVVHMLEMGLDVSPTGKTQNETLSIYAAMDGSVHIGPVHATVMGMGAHTTIDFDKPGKLGNADLEYGFKSPRGLGLDIKASAITGGGFIEYKKQEGEYSGIINLVLNQKIDVTAIAIVTTKDKPYAILVQIFGEFSPIQIGFGSTLNGVGGLAAIHRQVHLENLKSLFRRGEVERLMFPKDPIADASAILHTLDSAFPKDKGSHAFGLMGAFSWGTPSLVDFKVGVIVEIGGRLRFTILGTAHTILPDKKAKVVVLNLSMLGVIDIQDEYMSLEAKLYDSKLSKFDLHGGMAMYASWGIKPDFILSVGGFHSRYRLTTDRISVPERVGLSMSGDNWKFSMKAFMAITSNTFQVGARLDLEAWKGQYIARASAGYEALVTFNPFGFEVDIFFRIAVYKNNKRKMSADLDIYLTGPNPYHVRGVLKIKVWFLKFKVHISKTFGTHKTQEIQYISPYELLKQELNKPEVISYEIPPWQSNKISAKRDTTTPLMERGSIVIIKQNAVPLNTKIEHIGGHEINDDEKTFELQISNLNGIVPEDIDANFAPSQFKKLSDSEKLSIPAFASYNAGLRVKPKYIYGDVVINAGGYENIYIKDNNVIRLQINIVKNHFSNWIDINNVQRPLQRYEQHKNRISFVPPETAAYIMLPQDDNPQLESTCVLLRERNDDVIANQIPEEVLL